MCGLDPTGGHGIDRLHPERTGKRAPMTRSTTDARETERRQVTVRNTPTPSVPPSPASTVGAAPRRPSVRGLRTRLLFRFTILMAVALLASIFVARSILLSRVGDRIDARLVKEVGELHLFRSQAGPLVEMEFNQHVRELFRSFLAVDPPGPNESDLAFVDGRLLLRTPRTPPYALDHNADLMARWGSLTHPATGEIDTPAGPVDFRAETFTSKDGSRGVYVVAVFRNLEQQDVNQATAAAAGVALAALVVGSLLAWTTTGRALRPVMAVTRTAQSISETDLTRRIPVTGDDDEISRLSATFNDMLDRLESAFATQRAFLDDAGHELRTPITVITGQLELLEDDPEARRQTIGLVMGELDRMARIVNDLLLLAKAQQPNLLRFDTIDVAPLTEEILSKARSLTDRNWGCEAVGRGVIVADRHRLTEAVMQLADNAVKHAPDGALVLGSSVGDGVARFWVRDAGPGIAPEERGRIFDRFSRSRTDRRREGAGLGLAIVRAIAEAHHGSVQLDSVPGAGSTFTIVVPVDQPLPLEDAERG
jgi:signal transduction histidine kinase